jgi:hypothetical protein
MSDHVEVGIRKDVLDEMLSILTALATRGGFTDMCGVDSYIVLKKYYGEGWKGTERLALSGSAGYTSPQRSLYDFSKLETIRPRRKSR